MIYTLKTVSDIDEDHFIEEIMRILTRYGNGTYTHRIITHHARNSPTITRIYKVINPPRNFERARSVLSELCEINTFEGH